jgi:hypothetical protein
MTQRFHLAGMLAVAILAAASGCCPAHYCCVDDCCGGMAVAPDPCGSCCAADACGDCTSCCGVDPCGCDPCGCGPCGCGPCGGIFGGCLGLLTCGSGCSEMYWGEWASDPPACCDPCDNCGNWTGGGCCDPCCSCPGFHSLWGVRYMPSSCGPVCGECGGGCSVECGGCGSCGGCDSCGGAVETLGGVGPATEYQPAPAPTMPATASARQTRCANSGSTCSRPRVRYR